MTSFLRPLTSRLSRFWSAPQLGIPALAFALLMIHGSSVGLTDDEAYYWVLAQKPSLGFAFHPPMVTWIIALAEKLLSPFSAFLPRESVTRFPAVACACVTLGLAIQWLADAGASRQSLARGTAVLVSFAGFFALSWMVVPDLPLFFGWMVAFWATWRLCFGPWAPGVTSLAPMLAGGIAVAVLSKYSGVLIAGSSALALWIWSRGSARRAGLIAVGLGLLMAALPILVWNASHGWASILYQLRDRHEGAGLSWTRYGRFWAVQFLAAGPWLVGFGAIAAFRGGRALAGRSSGERVPAFIALWLLPAALVFCVQPLFSDFKPHWAFVVWWPAALALGGCWCAGESSVGRRWAVPQIGYGLVLILLIMTSSHFPVMAWVADRMIGSPLQDPRLDVTNDLYGWSELPRFLESEFSPEDRALPIVGSRYQTASQAAFAIGDRRSRVVLLPRDPRTGDEWPRLELASDSIGPEWPRLGSPVLYVADNRYDLPPAFRSAECARRGRIEARRRGYLSKWIDVWKCVPSAAPPGSRSGDRRRSG